jgi:5-methylcytosine-specific restriction endonuclease McrBC regulatory subunit McrC
MSEVEPLNVMAMIEIYSTRRFLKEERKQELEQAERQFREAERLLVEAMLEQGTKSVKDDKDQIFTMTPKCFMSFTLTNKEEVVTFLEARGATREDITREELHSTRCRELIKQIYSKEGKDVLPACLKFDDTAGITVRGWKSSVPSEKGGHDESSAV